MDLVLASSSKNRLRLLNQIFIYPNHICSPNIDETETKSELPDKLAVRLSKEKLNNIFCNFENAYIITADTVTACGRRILHKAHSDDEVRKSFKLLSGRRHQVYTSVCVAKIIEKTIVKSVNRLVKTSIKFKRLTEFEIEEYIKTKQGIGVSGGCAIEGIAESYILWMGGSYSNVIGLPLYETKCLLYGIGYLNKTER